MERLVELLTGDAALFMAVLIPSVILHEIAHGATALALGDPTARDAGRLTLNPLPHIDPFGTLILPALLAFSGFGVFGWAKPVPVSPRLLREPRQHSLYVGLAGPATNIVMALLAAAAFSVWRPEVAGTAGRVLIFLGITNVVLAVFNMLPVPPLDGSALIERLLPTRWWGSWLRFRQWSMGLLLVVVLFAPGGLQFVFEPAINAWLGLLR